MPAAAHRDEQVALARDADCRDHVGHPDAAHDRCGSAVDHAVPDPAGLVVRRIALTDDLAFDHLPQRVEIVRHHV
jgi:hypothetical protein